MSTSRSISNTNKEEQCGSTGSKFLDGLWLACLSAYSITLPSLSQILSLLAHPAVQRGRLALVEFISNRRHVVGLCLGLVGVGAIFAYQLFDISARSYDWYYLNNYYFLFSLRLWIAIIFFSTAKFLCAPQKWRSHWVVYALAVSVGLCGVVHYSFFVHDDISYHSFTAWYMVLVCTGAGLGFIKAVDYLCYRKYHLKDGNYARIIGMIEMDMPWSEKEKTLKLLAKEYRDFNSRI